MSDQWVFGSAAEQALMIAERRISVREMMAHVERRFELVNGDLNAVIETRTEQAHERAAELDNTLARRPDAPLPPLFGVPMTIKESWDWLGTASTSGNRSLVDHRPLQNARVVQHLVDAGAVIWGKTNLPVNMADWQSFNAIYGTTNNPWDVSRSPGGSSGGAAAALAAGVTPLEVGSDIGGSIRNPAHYCGVYGHKSSFGSVPTEGHGLPGTTVELDLGVGGPMARTAADLRLGFSIMADVGVDNTVPARFDSRPVQLKGLKVAVLLEHSSVAQTSELTTTLDRYVQQMAELGVEVDVGAAPDVDLSRAHHVYLSLLRSTVGAHGSERNYQRQQQNMQRWNDGDRGHLAYIAYGTTLSHWQWTHYKQEQTEIASAWADFFASYDFLVCPAAASTALAHDQDGHRADRTLDVDGSSHSVLDQLFWAGIASLPYLPATVVPAGLSTQGLPAGLQIIGPHMADFRCLAFAQKLEETLGGFVHPPDFAV